ANNEPDKVPRHQLPRLKRRKVLCRYISHTVLPSFHCLKSHRSTTSCTIGSCRYGSGDNSHYARWLHKRCSNRSHHARPQVRTNLKLPCRTTRICCCAFDHHKQVFVADLDIVADCDLVARGQARQ